MAGGPRSRIARFMKASLRQKLAVAELAARFAAARILIACVPFRLWRRMAGPLDGEAEVAACPPSERDLRRARGAAGILALVLGRRFASRTCLAQAVALRSYLMARGIATQVRIGARREPGADLAMHAWLMLGDHVLVGGAQARNDYEQLHALRGNRPTGRE